MEKDESSFMEKKKVNLHLKKKKRKKEKERRGQKQFSERQIKSYKIDTITGNTKTDGYRGEKSPTEGLLTVPNTN